MLTKYYKNVKSHNEKVYEIFEELTKDVYIDTNMNIKDVCLGIDRVDKNLEFSISLFCKDLLYSPHFKVLADNNTTYNVLEGINIQSDIIKNTSEIKRIYADKAEIDQKILIRVKLDPNTNYTELYKYLNFNRFLSLMVFYEIFVYQREKLRTCKDFFNYYKHMNIRGQDLPQKISGSDLIEVLDKISMKDKAICIHHMLWKA
jgi:hypothetical protein